MSAFEARVGPTGRVFQVKVFDDATILSTGNGKASVFIPNDLDGLILTKVQAHVTTVSSSGAITVMVRRNRGGADADMLSTAITIDQSEKDSATAATPPVINASNDDVLDADEIWIDVDAAGTGAKGLAVNLSFAEAAA